MTARKASTSSKNFPYDASLLLPTHGGRSHESSAVQADASSAAPFILHDASSSLQSNAAAGGKSSSVVPDHSPVRMGKAVMQSCWIQRLNPACQTSTLEEEERTESSHVWTHFTKDFSSCSKRLQKARHHTRSSSWPPNERIKNCSPSPDLKLVEPVDIKEQYLLSRETLPMFGEENSRVPFEDGSESNDFCFKTGNLFSNQYSSRKSVSTLEALVPCSHTARKCDEYREKKSKDEGKPKNFAAQRFQWLSNNSASFIGNLTLFKKPLLNPKLSKESGSLLEVGSTKVVGDAPCKAKFSASERAHTMVHIRGSSPDAVIGTSLSPAIMGASADADDRTCISPSLLKDVCLSTPSKLSNNRLAVVFGDTEKKSHNDRLGVTLKNSSGKACGKEIKSRQNFGFLHVAGQAKTLNQSRANPSVCSGSCNRGCFENVGVCNRSSCVSTAFKSIEREQNVGFGTFVTNAGPFVTKELYNLQSLNANSRSCDPVVVDRALNPKEEVTTKRALTKVSSGDFIRPSRRETSLNEYWVQLFEDSGPLQLLDASHSKVTPPQEHATDKCNILNFNSKAYIWKPDEKEKLESFSHLHPHMPLNTNDQIHYSCDVPQQKQVSLRRSFIQTAQMGLGHNQGSLADRGLLEGSSMARTLQEESLQGGMRRLASKIDKREHNLQGGLAVHAITDASVLPSHRLNKFCDNTRTTEHSRLNQAWIQRWQSSSNLMDMPGKTLSPSLGMDEGLDSAPSKCPVITSYKGARDVDCFDRNVLEPGRRTSKLHMDGSTRHYDSALGVTARDSLPVYRSHASLRGKCIAPSIEAMAIVGNTAGKLHTTSLQNRGSFSVWPCPSSEENFQERGLSEPKETVEDNMHGMDMDDLEFLERKRK